MKKININVSKVCLVSLFFSFVFLIILFKGTYSDSNGGTVTLDRDKLQELIVSTGLSYYYNKEYSDYEQYAMDDKHEEPYQYSSFNWRSFGNSPEMVNRANEFNIDCSSFVFLTYINSLGYDMAEYSDLFGINYFFDNFKWISSKSSLSNFKKAYFQYGKGLSTSGISKVADIISGHNGKVGDEYINAEDTNTSSVVYHYMVDLSSEYSYNESASEIEKIRDNIISILQPGDTLIYRRKNKSTEKITGHMILYVGGILNSNDRGFIHATGDDFGPDDDPITIGEDEYSIKYDTWDNMFESQIFVNSKSNASYEFSIIRPINTYCESGKDICTLDIDLNVMTRNYLSNLRIEQYQNTLEKTDVSSLGKYNSVNNGDEVTYNLVLTNMSKFNYCERGNPEYSTKETCEKAGYKWMETNRDEITYTNLIIEGKIPEGSVYVECNNSCEYNKKDNTVKWIISKISPKDYEKLSYTVKVSSDNDLINSGMKITSGENTLLLGELTLHVNPTLNEDINKNIVNENVEKFKNLVDKGKIIYNSSSSGSNYKLDLDEITSSEISKLGFIKSIYYNSFGIDLNFLTSGNIKNAIFNADPDGIGVFAKKSESQISELTNDSYKKINKMLVKGMYGGRLLKGDDNSDRARFLKTTYLEFGDILVTYDKNNINSLDVYMWLGYDSDSNSIVYEFDTDSSGNGKVFVYDGSASSGKTGKRIFKEMFACGLFVVLRPSQLFGTTINYDYNGGSGDTDTYVTYNTYQYLEVPSKETYSVTLKYNDADNTEKTYKISNNFDGWYSDSNFLNKVVENDILVDANTHTLYAKWKTDTIKLPLPVRDGYSFLGWYSDSELVNKVSDGESDYLTSGNVVLYAKWKNNNTDYSLEFDSALKVDMNNKYIKGLTANETISQFLNKVMVRNASIRVENKDGKVKTASDKIATGYILVIYDDDSIKEKYFLSVLGDANGDGNVSLTDLSQMRKHIVGNINTETGEIYKKEGVYYHAIDMNSDGNVSLTDLSKIRKVIVGSNHS